jgi:CheY-like chemotaxis protein
MLDEPIHTSLTGDQATQAARLVETFLARYDAGLCPCCETPIEREVQRGRCVYAEPCGCRLGQGVARSEEELELRGEKGHNRHLQKEGVTMVKKASEVILHKAVWKSLALFLEGSASLNWIIDALEYADVRGSELAEILDDLRGHGNPELHHAVSTVCRQKGWIDSPDEPGRPLALVIEDHEDAAVIFANALQGTGFDIEIVRSGDTALTWLAETTPTVVILDLLLPKVPGAEILRRIRADARLAGVYVIVATAYPDMTATLSSQADQTLFKPVSYVQLHDLATRLGAKYAGGVGQPGVPVVD